MSVASVYRNMKEQVGIRHKFRIYFASSYGVCTKSHMIFSIHSSLLSFTESLCHCYFNIIPYTSQWESGGCFFMTLTSADIIVNVFTDG